MRAKQANKRGFDCRFFLEDHDLQGKLAVEPDKDWNHNNHH
jgi:hypothetical protein